MNFNAPNNAMNAMLMNIARSNPNGMQALQYIQNASSLKEAAMNYAQQNGINIQDMIQKMMGGQQ